MAFTWRFSKKRPNSKFVILNSLKVHSRLQPFFKESIKKVSALSGGDISQAFLIETAANSRYFVKLNDSVQAMDMFQQEAAGLKRIANSKTIAVPEVIGVHAAEQGAVLVLEYIAPNSNSTEGTKRLGEQLAAMHHFRGTTFGLDTDNYIGRLKQKNQHSRDWVYFYAQQRLHYQFQLACSHGLLSKDELPLFEYTIEILEKLILVPQPRLIHGDLWGGNFLIGKNNKPFLIDPAVYFGDPIVDIAMSQLFGGFGKAFYESYNYWSPQVENLKERIDLYQLYYLLVHLNMFGRSYYGQVKTLIDRYF